MALRVRRPAPLGHTTPTHPPTPHRTASMCLLVATRSKGHHRPLCAHQGPGRTRLASRAASTPVPVTTPAGADRHRRRPALLGHISPTLGSPLVHLPLLGIMSTLPLQRPRAHALRGHTTPTPDRVHRWTALTPALVTTLTNLVRGGRPHALSLIHI